MSVFFLGGEGGGMLFVLFSSSDTLVKKKHAGRDKSLPLGPLLLFAHQVNEIRKIVPIS